LSSCQPIRVAEQAKNKAPARGNLYSNDLMETHLSVVGVFLLPSACLMRCSSQIAQMPPLCPDQSEQICRRSKAAPPARGHAVLAGPIKEYCIEKLFSPTMNKTILTVSILVPLGKTILPVLLDCIRATRKDARLALELVAAARRVFIPAWELVRCRGRRSRSDALK
jgi:hypothetical protein